MLVGSRKSVFPRRVLVAALVIVSISLLFLPVFSLENAVNIPSYGKISDLSIIGGLQTNGTTFALGGNIVRLTGVHMTLWPDSDERYKEKYFDWLKNWGINTIMLNFGWNFLEPTKGVYDQEYLAKMDRFIVKAKTRGIYVVLRMLKWAYPWAYQADYPPWPESWIVGYPRWIEHTPDFWENVGNCWDNYIAMWTMLAERYKNEPYVAGFELFAEPGQDIGPGIYDAEGEAWDTWRSNTCRKVMGVLFDEDKLYERTINAIHSICRKVVIIEGFAYGVLRYIKDVGDTERTNAIKPNSENFAIGQSVYDWLQFEWLDGQKAVTDEWNVPFIATEFGVKVSVIDSPEPEKVAWVEEACQEFATRNMEWFYWHFGPGHDGDFNLVDETDDSVSPILSDILSTYTFGLLPAPF
jgi:endoglycosylceramidase